MISLPSTTKAAQAIAKNHVDPPGLWTSAIVTSLAIHLVLGGVFLAPLLRKPPAQQTGRKLIPITTVSLNREQNETAAPAEDSAAATTPAPQRQSISSPKPQKIAAKPANSTSQPPQPTPRSPRPAPQTPIAPQPSPSARSPQQPTPSPSPSPPSSPPPSPQQPTPSPSPSLPSPKPSPPSSQPPEPTVPINPSPEPTVSPAQSSAPSPPSPAPSSTGFTAQILDLQRTWSGDTVTQVARAKQTQQKLDSLNYLTPLDIKLEGEVVIEAIAIVEADGTPTVVQPEAAQVIQGNLSTEKAGKLAQRLIEQWTFEPTYMAGQAVPQDYRIRIRLSPLYE